MPKKEKKQRDETEVVPVFQPFVLPVSGVMSLRKLADYIGVEKVKDLVSVLPDGAVIIKMGKLSNSLIDLAELRKNLVTVGSLRQPVAPIVPPAPVPVPTPPPVQPQVEEDEE